MRVTMAAALSMALVASTSTVAPTPALARTNPAPSNCVCRAMWHGEDSSIGQITEVGGTIEINGLPGTPQGTKLFPGTTLKSVGEKSFANFVIGKNCMGYLPANNQLTISKTGNNLCVMVSEVPSGLATTQVVLTVGGFAVLAGGVVALSGGKKGASN